MTTAHSPQWRRYCSPAGRICVHRTLRNIAALITNHTPEVSLRLDRASAARGLRKWRSERL